MPDLPVTINNPTPGGQQTVLTDYVSAAITAGTNKKEWIATHAGSIDQVAVDSAGAGSGAGNDVIDVNINGTTIFTTQARRPTRLATDTGYYTVGMPEAGSFKAGDIIGYDVDSVGASGGGTRTSLAIICKRH